jgi:hypothetical protein
MSVALFMHIIVLTLTKHMEFLKEDKVNKKKFLTIVL